MISNSISTTDKNNIMLRIDNEKYINYQLNLKLEVVTP